MILSRRISKASDRDLHRSCAVSISFFITFDTRGSKRYDSERLGSSVEFHRGAPYSQSTRGMLLREHLGSTLPVAPMIYFYGYNKARGTRDHGRVEAMIMTLCWGFPPLSAALFRRSRLGQVPWRSKTTARKRLPLERRWQEFKSRFGRLQTLTGRHCLFVTSDCTGKRLISARQLPDCGSLGTTTRGGFGVHFLHR